MSEFKPDIWRLQAQFNTQGLVDALKNEDAGIRRRAAAALRALGAFQAIADLEAALEKETDDETHAVMAAVLSALQQEEERVKSGIRDTVEQLSAVLPGEVQKHLDQLKSNDPEQVMQAAKALGDLGDKVAVPALVVRFTDPTISIKVRLVVADALLKLESAPVEVALLGALRSPEWRIRRNGAAILGQLRAQWAVEPLSKALQDENEIVRKTAYAALRHINTPEAREALESARQAALRNQRLRLETATHPIVSTDETTATSEAPAANDAHLEAADISEAVSGQAASTPDETSEQSEKDDTQKLVWPSKRRKPIHPTLAPTKPLDPQTLENARRYMEQRRSREDQEDEP